MPELSYVRCIRQSLLTVDLYWIHRWYYTLLLNYIFPIPSLNWLWEAQGQEFVFEHTPLWEWVNKRRWLLQDGPKWSQQLIRTRGKAGLTSCLRPPQARRASFSTSFTAEIASPDYFIIKSICLLFHVSLFPERNFWMYLELKNAEVRWDHVKLSPAERAPVNVLGHGWLSQKSGWDTCPSGCYESQKALIESQGLCLLSGPSECPSLLCRWWFCRSSKVALLRSFHTPLPNSSEQIWWGRKLQTWRLEPWLWISVLPLINSLSLAKLLTIFVFVFLSVKGVHAYLSHCYDA